MCFSLSSFLFSLYYLWHIPKDRVFNVKIHGVLKKKGGGKVKFVITKYMNA
jgi:hypothetical protein